MFKIRTKLARLRDITIITLKLYRHKKEKDYYLIPLNEWDDNRNTYSLDMLVDEKGNIIDYFYSYEIQKDIEGMYQ